MTEKEKVIDKIQKLLALATSPNEHEAKLAADKANEILIQYNLTMQEVDRQMSEYETNDVFHSARVLQEETFVCSILKGFFFVDVIYKKRLRQGTTVCLIGEATNVQVAAYVRSFLINSFKRLWNEYRKSTGAESSSKRAYYLGLTRGLEAQLQATRSSIQADRQMVLVKDPNIEKYKRELFTNIKTVSFNPIRLDGNAMSAGAEAGKSLRISRGIEHKGDNSGKYLE